MSLEHLFNPRRVAVFGSAGEGKLANVLIHRLLDGGFGDVRAVNPKGMGVATAPGFRSLDEAPGGADLAVIASPAATVPSVLEDCGRNGVGAAVIISSGFSEAGEHEMEREVIKTARRHGIRFIGPNCAGMVSTQSHLVATLETAPPAGHISLISQSGAVGGSFMYLSARSGVGISKFLSYGNGGDLGVTDFLRYLRDDDDTRVIALYLESIPSGREFMEAVRDASAAKPVVAVKAGRSSVGRRAALSHTGSMAGADAVCDAALRQCGAIRVDTLGELFELCKGFSMMPPVRGRRLAIVTNSGGPGVMTADRAEERGLVIAESSDAVRARLRESLPSYAGIGNPIDLTVEGTPEQYESSIKIALSEADCATAIYVGTPYLKAMPIAEAVAGAAASSGKPVAAIMQVGSDIDAALAYLRDRGLPVFEEGEDAASVLARMARYEGARGASRGAAAAVPEPEGRSLPPGGLLEPEAMALLRENGIAVPDHVFARTEDEAAAGAEKLGFPVAVKVVSPGIIHKSDCGGVALGVAGADDARQAFARMGRVCEGAGAEFRGVMIYPMLRGGTEVMIGLTNDPTFGPVVAFGLGGIYAEALRDITFRVAPVSEAEAREMTEEIKAAAILRGMRGEPPADVDALARMISAFSRLPFLYPDIAEADLNPVFVRPDGAIAADVRILTRLERPANIRS